MLSIEKRHSWTWKISHYPVQNGEDKSLKCPTILCRLRAEFRKSNAISAHFALGSLEQFRRRHFAHFFFHWSWTKCMPWRTRSEARQSISPMDAKWLHNSSQIANAFLSCLVIFVTIPLYYVKEGFTKIFVFFNARHHKHQKYTCYRLLWIPRFLSPHFSQFYAKFHVQFMWETCIFYGGRFFILVALPDTLHYLDSPHAFVVTFTPFHPPAFKRVQLYKANSLFTKSTLGFCAEFTALVNLYRTYINFCSSQW